MSVSSIGIVIDRIKVATEESRIAVFSVYGSDSLCNAVFDNTVMTQSLISSEGSGYVGSYHKNMEIASVLDEIVESVCQI